MKLYTEEQVRRALKMVLGSLKISTENDIINSLNPIYLPSDNDDQSSSIEWLIKQFETTEFYCEEAKENVKEQAKAMHKEEIIKAFDEGQEYEYQYHINSTPKFDSETYYNENYGGNNE